FKRFVEIGRVVLINYGPFEGKLAVIIDVVDSNKALVDGPETGVPRQMIPFKRLALTDFKLKIQRNARHGTIINASKEADLLAKWEATSWAKKRSNKAKRAAMTDFQRFQVMVAQKEKSAILKSKVAELQKTA
ncbi:unnamed protein product, partial [Discosporangium mesarthrocarpum]